MSSPARDAAQGRVATAAAREKGRFDEQMVNQAQEKVMLDSINTWDLERVQRFLYQVMLTERRMSAEKPVPTWQAENPLRVWG